MLAGLRDPPHSRLLYRSKRSLMSQLSFIATLVRIARPVNLAFDRLHALSRRLQACSQRLAPTAIKLNPGRLPKGSRILAALNHQGDAKCHKNPNFAPPDFAPPAQPTETAQLNWHSLNRLTFSLLASLASPGRCIPFAGPFALRCRFSRYRRCSPIMAQTGNPVTHPLKQSGSMRHKISRHLRNAKK
jgi:hypothetical protein